LFQNEAGIRFRACSLLHLIGQSWPANRAVATNGKAKLYKSLLISPVEAWVTLRGHITDYRFAGVRVVHSELGGKYDALALEMVKYIKLPSGWESQTGTHVSSRRVRFDVLVYTIKDGKMAIGFAQLDEAEGTVASYCGPALMAIEKDGKWELVDSGRSG
jgi:hypothetical protein